MQSAAPRLSFVVDVVLRVREDGRPLAGQCDEGSVGALRLLLGLDALRLPPELPRPEDGGNAPAEPLGCLALPHVIFGILDAHVLPGHLLGDGQPPHQPPQGGREGRRERRQDKRGSQINTNSHTLLKQKNKYCLFANSITLLCEPSSERNFSGCSLGGKDRLELTGLRILAHSR